MLNRVALHGFALACLVIFYYLGVWLQKTAGIVLPGPLLGLLLLLCALIPMRRVPIGLLSTSQFLLRHLSLFFIPATLSVMLFKETLGQHIGLIIAVLTVTTVVSLVLSALICQASLKNISDD